MSMITCKKCGNLASYNSYFGKYYCSVCGEYFDNNIVTNADYFRSMTDEQLAEAIDNSNYCLVPSGFVGTEHCDAASDCKSCILNWLKQPYIKENF